MQDFDELRVVFQWDILFKKKFKFYTDQFSKYVY